MDRIRNLHPAWVAGIIAACVLLWLASGMVGGKSGEPAQTDVSQQNGTDLVKVEVATSHAEQIIREAVVNSRTAPVRSVRVRAETAGRVTEVVTQRGAKIDRNGVIVRLALDDRGAQQRQAQAVLEQRKLQYQAAQRLREQDYMTEVDLAQSKANLEIARAEVERIEKDISHTVIRAPFAGVLETRPVEVGDYVSVGDEIGYIIEQDPFIVRGSVSEDVVGYLQAGQPGQVRLISGETQEGVLRYIAGQADPETRTYAVELLVPNPDGRLIAGTSALMRLPLEDVSAHRLEPATLTLNEAGEFGIKSVDDNGLVRFHKADIVRNENNMVWLANLPETLNVITVGQGFVSSGDQVDIVKARGAQARQDDDLVMVEEETAGDSQ